MAYNMRITVVPRTRPHAAPARASVLSSSASVARSVPSPVPGAGGSPRPLQPTWTTAMRSRSNRVARPIVVKQRYLPPAIDGLPNQSVVVVPRGLGRRIAPAIVSNPPTSAIGIVLPNRPVVVPRSRRRRRLFGLVAVLPGDAFEMVSPTTIGPIVVPVPPRRTLAAPSIALRTSYDTTREQAPHQVRPVVVPTSRRRRRLFGLAMVLPGDAFEMMPPTVMRPVVVPAWPSKARNHRPPTLVVAKSSENPRAIPAFQPIVVPAHPHPRLAARAISSLHRKFVEPPPEHFPLPRTLVVRPPRRAASLPLRPIVSKSAYQFPGNMVDRPWDLIAASIAHLRSDSGVVAAFGDAPESIDRRKFVSDVELPKTDPPYVVFTEPIEAETYETADGSGRNGSTVYGVFVIEVVSTEKLDARTKADAVAARLQDAPLEFVDGTLLYLRRSERRFPTFRSAGPRGDVVIYKRIIEFRYIIERFF